MRVRASLDALKNTSLIPARHCNHLRAVGRMQLRILGDSVITAHDRGLQYDPQTPRSRSRTSRRIPRLIDQTDIFTQQQMNVEYR